MNGSRSKRLVAYSCALTLLCAAAFFGTDRYGRSQRTYHAFGPVTATSIDRVQVNTPEEAYAHWQAKGLHGRKLLCFVGEWEKIKPESFFNVPQERQYPLDLFTYARALEEQRLDRTSFLYIATVTGIARGLEVVIPDRIYRHLAEQARSTKNASFSGEGVKLTYNGLPRTFMMLNHLRTPPEPVLVYVEASFFREHTPEALLNALARVQIRSDCLVLCRMTNDERVSAGERARLAAFAKAVGMPESIGRTTGEQPS